MYYNIIPERATTNMLLIFLLDINWCSEVNVSDLASATFASFLDVDGMLKSEK